MKKLSLVIPLLVLAACAPEKKPVTTSASASALDTTTPISPAAATGLWIDKSEVAAYRSTRKLTEDTCDESASVQAPSVSILLFHKDGGIYQYDPSRRTRPEDRLLHFRNGALESDGKGSEALEPGEKITLHRSRSGVRLHLRQKNPDSGKFEEIDQELSRVTVSEAREIAQQDQLCAHTPPANRLNELAPGTGQVIVRDGANGRTIELGEKNGNAVGCSGSADGSRIFMSAERKRDDGKFGLEGVSISFPAGTDLHGQSALTAKIGDASAAVQVMINLADDKDGAYSGTCLAWVRKSSYILDADVRCDVERTSLSTQEHRKFDVEGRLSCSRLTIPKKK